MVILGTPLCSSALLYSTCESLVAQSMNSSGQTLSTQTACRAPADMAAATQKRGIKGGRIVAMRQVSAN